MIQFDVKVRGLKSARALFDGMAKQLPYATSVALNATAFDVRAEEKNEITRAFDNPVPFVRNSPRVEKSTKRALSAAVYIDERIQQALVHQVEGGPRLPRDVARKLRSMGILRGNEYTTYNPEFTNSRGNLTLARWRKILAEVNQPGGKFFVDPKRKSIWIKRGRGGRQARPIVFITARRPTYRQRFDFYGTAQRTVSRVFDANFDRAMARAVRTAR